MNTVQRIAKNAGALVVAQVITNVIGLFYMMYAARYLGASGFGIITFALAFSAIFGVLADLGLNLLTAREVARDRSLALKYLANVGAMKMLLAVLTYGLVIIAINLTTQPQQTVNVTYIVGASVLFTVLNQTFNSIFQAYERLEYQSLAQVINSVMLFGGVMLAIRFNFNVVGFAFIFLVASIVVAVNGFIMLRIRLTTPHLTWAPWKVEFDWSFWKKTLKEALPFGIAIAFVTTFYWVNSVILSMMKGDAEVGWYNAAYRMVMALLFFPAAVIGAIYPVMSRQYVQSLDSLRFAFGKSLKYLTILGVPIGVGTTLLASRFILLIFGEGYANSVIALQILVWSTVFIFMSITFGNLFNSLNRQAIVTKITGICLVANIILNLSLIPGYGVIGASAAYVATEFLSLALSFVSSSKIGYGIPKMELVNTFFRVFIASALMGLFIHYLQGLNLFLLVFLAALLYFAALYIINGIDRQDLSLFRSVFQKRTVVEK